MLMDEDGKLFLSVCLLGFLGGSVVKNLPANAGDAIPCLGWEESLEEEMSTRSLFLPVKIPQTEEPGRAPWGCKELDTT